MELIKEIKHAESQAHEMVEQARHEAVQIAEEATRQSRQQTESEQHEDIRAHAQQAHEREEPHRVRPGDQDRGEYGHERQHRRHLPPQHETEDEVEKKFGAINVTLLHYTEAGLNALKGGRKSLWPLLLLFLAAVLAMEMILANGIPLPVFKIGSAVRAS